MYRKFLVAILLLAVFVLPVAAYADEIIREGETVSVDLNISDDLQIEAGGTLDANAHIFNGDAEIAGTITGNLLILGGDVELTESAEITGECVLLGGEVKSNSSSTNCTAAGSFDIDAPNVAVASLSNELNLAPRLQTEGSFAGTIFGSLLFGLFAFAAAHIAPNQLNQIGDTITAKPVTSGTVGILTFFSTISAITLLTIISAALLIVCVGILGFPIILAVMALLGAGLFLGWVAVGTIVGEIAADLLHLHKLSLPLTAALGTVALSLAVGLLGLTPVIGFSSALIWWLIGGIGLGAAALTRLGTRSYPAFAVRPEKIDQVIETLDI